MAVVSAPVQLGQAEAAAPSVKPELEPEPELKVGSGVEGEGTGVRGDRLHSLACASPKPHTTGFLHALPLPHGHPLYTLTLCI